MTERLVTIIPPTGSGAQCTQGSRVVNPDGSEIEGVTKIVITGECNDVWRAQIECLARMAPITALAVVTYPRRMLTWRERVLGYTE